MTNFQDYWNSLKETPAPNMPTITQKRGPDFSGNPLQDVQQIGGYALTKTLAGVSGIGQGITGFFRTLEDDKAMYDQLFGANEDGTYTNAGKFRWDKLDDLFSNAARGGFAQAQRTWSSNNLTELGQNATSYAEVLKNLPGPLGAAFSVDDTRTKIGTATLGLILDVMLDPAGMVGKVGAASKILPNGQRVTQGGKLFGSTIIGSTGVRNVLARRGVEETGLYATGGGIAKGLVGMLTNNEKALDVSRRVGGNLAIGNVFGAAAVVPARTMVDGVVQFGRRIASDSGHRYFKQANALLDWFGSPLMSADKTQAINLVKGVALSEELPRLTNVAAQTQQTLLTRVKGAANQRKATMLFNDLVVADPETGREPILKKLSALGIKAEDAESVADTYQTGVYRMIDLLKDSGHAELVDKLKLSPQHIPLVYRINMGGKIKEDQLSFLQQINTSASWELRQGQYGGGTLRSRLAHLLTGGAPNSPEFFKLTSGSPDTLESMVGKVKNSSNSTFPMSAALNAKAGPNAQAFKDFVGPDAAVKFAEQKLTPLSLLENKKYGVSDDALRRFGILTDFSGSKKLPVPKDTNLGSPGVFSGGGKSPKILDTPVGKLDDTLNPANSGASGFSSEPTRLPKGFGRVSVRDKVGVEEAKATLQQMRKEAILGLEEGEDLAGQMDYTLATVGNNIAVDQRGYLYAVDTKGLKTGLFVRDTANGGVTLVAPDTYAGLVDDLVEETGATDVYTAYLKGGYANEDPLLDAGQTARAFAASDNSRSVIEGYGREVPTKTVFEVPAVAGINNPGVKLPSTFPKNYAKTDLARGQLAQKVDVRVNNEVEFTPDAELTANTTKNFTATGFQNEAVRPTFPVTKGGFGKLDTGKALPPTARVLGDEDMEVFFSDLADYMDGLRDKGNNVLGKYHELEQGGDIVSYENGQKVTRSVNAQEYWKWLREQKKEKTVADLIEFAGDWGKDRNIPKDIRLRVGQLLGEALTYVPGSREFSMGVKVLREGDNALDEIKKFYGDAWSEVAGREGQSLSDITLDPVHHHLYGKVDDFGVRAMEEGRKLSEVTARTLIVDRMKEAGIMQENPFPGAINMRERIGPEEAKLLGLEGEVGKDWWIAPGNLSAYQNAFNALKLGGPVERILQPYANAFRSAALKTDASAHVTQFLGNLAMMTHMGYGPLFDDPRKLVSGFKRTFNSVVMMDDNYQDMVESGLQITMSPLSEGQRQLHAERMLLRSDSRNESFRDVAEKMHSTWTTLFQRANDSVVSQVERVEDAATRAMTRKTGDYVDARNITQAMKPGTMFAMHDMVTRAYVWDQVLRHETSQLVEANPWLTHFVGKNGLIEAGELSAQDEAAWLTKLKTLGLENEAQNISLDDAKLMASELKLAKTRAAEIGNEVALNYFEVPRAIRLATQTGVVPFFKFQWKAMGRFMEWMDERPFQFAPYYKATTNANAAFSDKPEDWIQSQQSLPQNVRNALTMPTGTKDQLGRPEFIDLSRWVPFGMFSGAAGGASNVDGSALPNQLVTAPLVELAFSIFDGQDADGRPLVAEGQSKIGAVAQKLALMFSPSGIGPGGRRAQQLANAMEQSKFVLDENGQPMFSNPLMNVGAQWGRLPQNIATELGHLVGDTGASTGTQRTPDVSRPWTTPTQTITRGLFPGATYSADSTKAYAQIDNAFEGRITKLKNAQGTIVNSMTYQMEPQKYAARLQEISVQIQQLEEQKTRQLGRLILGEQ